MSISTGIDHIRELLKLPYNYSDDTINIMIDTPNITTPCFYPYSMQSQRLNDLKCLCYTGYYGNHCENVHIGYIEIAWIFYISLIVATFIMAIRATIKLIHLIFFQIRNNSKTKQIRLAYISIILNFVAIWIQFAFRSIPNRLLLPHVITDKILDEQFGYTIGIMNAVAKVPIMCSFCLILGFWFSITRNKLNNMKFAAHARIACWVCAGLTVLMVPGTILWKLEIAVTISNIIIVAPYIINSIVFIIISIRLIIYFNVLKSNDDTYLTYKKQFYNLKYIVLGTISVCSISILGFSQSMLQKSPDLYILYFIIHVFLSIAELLFFYSCIKLTERRNNIKKILLDFKHCKYRPIINTYTTEDDR